jgi:hypothetical protein
MSPKQMKIRSIAEKMNRVSGMVFAMPHDGALIKSLCDCASEMGDTSQLPDNWPGDGNQYQSSVYGGSGRATDLPVDRFPKSADGALNLADPLPVL